ncbi:hypothetical protein [Salinibacterium sp. ZJ450]|uniref:hypothetical protein n=1 Tax=Salinibacterium sp. ZJ450 TaxID=2708338 RepID=UPI00141F65E2|nr:hypothetical protein [Salinibacterium sp. ZJ450]
MSRSTPRHIHPRHLLPKGRRQIGALTGSLLALTLMFGAGFAYEAAEPVSASASSAIQEAPGKSAAAHQKNAERKAQQAAPVAPPAAEPVAEPAQPVTQPAPAPAPATPAAAAAAGSGTSSYPMHTKIAATTFWVGEIFDANAADGSQMLSTYDANWFANYGGCDGVSTGGACDTEPRVAANGFFPSSMTPKQNPFYLDLPYDDVNDPTGFANRGAVIPWANDPAYAGQVGEQGKSLMKNRWVKLMKDGQTCYGQIADAGPGEYHDSEYVFGAGDARPANARYGGAGMDVSPALNGCLGFSDLNGMSDLVDWQFINYEDVPAGPWLNVHSNDNTVIN